MHVAGTEHPVSLEVLGGSVYEMISQGRCLYDLFNDVAKNVVIKIPVCSSICPDGERAYDGIKAIRVLSSKGIPVNTTLIMSPEQALLAAKAGAKYVSPFVGRIDDLLHNKQDDNGVVSGVDLVAKIVRIFKNYNLKTEVLAASIRNTQHVCEVALAGAHIATVPCNILYQMVAHPKTYEGMKKFTDDIVPEYRALFV